MKDNAALLNVVDVEATCWPGRAPAGAVSEIIEIGLTVVDLAARERIGKHRILVRPERSSVGEFCTELTGLTQDEVDTGVSFAEACRILAAEHAAGTRAWASWGDYDRKQFASQCAMTGVTYPFGQRHTNAKLVFSEAYELRRRQGMAEALRIAGLPLEGRHHRGEDDAWNIAALVLDMVGRDAWRLTSTTD
ncbi:3'-5' exonuclease [Nocardia amikacinitolerans]|uniref:3'-5' exonuclease n=1 Tax=Nocardia amikacinitolerans TaxID=756689 RepID=UPI0020A44782|nr:3'-5' exonuclease [Nocardia amikacinitolerans]MCP2275771.1 Inhibitor of the KinA pathway to sporulation, predicted exonuclease [Nocardia amikacinitolerans]MCP2294042.1 Inhibitor of the KinA pathway to sporulation, predicted exonuclease [Nocardia amikacinitolerans]